jgi:hypothetical protein
MKFKPQVIEEGAEYQLRWDFSYRDIPAGLAVNTPQVFPLGGVNGNSGYWNGVNNAAPQMKDGDIITQAELHITTPFALIGTVGFNSDTMSLGDQGLATRYFSAVEGNANGAFVNDSLFLPASAYIYKTAVLPQYLQFTLNSMAAFSLSQLNQGKIYIVIQFVRAGDKAKNLDLTKPAYV